MLLFFVFSLFVFLFFFEFFFFFFFKQKTAYEISACLVGSEMCIRDRLVARVRPTGSMRNRCGNCFRRCPRYDAGEGRRRWRALDAGTIQVQLEADAPRVSCRSHGVTVAA